MKISRYCICGAYERGELSGPMGKAFTDLWKVQHTGPGHAQCDARTANRALIKAELEADRREKALR